jgi:hypothetical protein
MKRLLRKSPVVERIPVTLNILGLYCLKWLDKTAQPVGWITANLNPIEALFG